MARSPLARRRALTSCACISLAAALAGCTTAASSTVSVTGKTLTIYSSNPASNPAPAASGQQASDVLSAERLALEQAGGQVGTFKVVLKPLTGTTFTEFTDNARTAVKDSSTIAYLGELAPGTSYAASVPITNELGILQVSPGDTAIELTQSTPAVPSAPNHAYPFLKTYGRTFGRVVPSAALEARAQVQEMKALHVKELYVAGEAGSDTYGAAVALAVRQVAASTAPAIKVVPGKVNAASIKASRADALFLGTASPSTAARAFDELAAVDPKVKLFGPSALAGEAFAAGVSSPAAQRNVYVSSPGFLNGTGPTPAGRKFGADFQAAYHHAPGAQAIFGYEAMAVLLDALRQADKSAGTRNVVAHDFFALKDRPSVLGTYSMNADGDIELAAGAPFVFSHFKQGRLVPFKFVPAR